MPKTLVGFWFQVFASREMMLEFFFFRCEELVEWKHLLLYMLVALKIICPLYY